MFMTTKTLTIMEDAYDMLVKHKGKNQSFSDVIRELAASRKGNIESVLKCAGLWEGKVSDKEAEDMKRLIIAQRKSSTKKLLEKVSNL